MAVLLEATRDLAFFEPEDRAHWEWNNWQITTFSPDVFRHFTLLFTYVNSHGR